MNYDQCTCETAQCPACQSAYEADRALLLACVEILRAVQFERSKHPMSGFPKETVDILEERTSRALADWDIHNRRKGVTEMSKERELLLACVDALREVTDRQERHPGSWGTARAALAAWDAAQKGDEAT